MLLFRYVAKQVAIALVVILCIVLLILMSNQLVRYMRYIAEGRLVMVTLFKMLGLQCSLFLMILLPLSLFLALVFVYGRLYDTQEMVIIQGCVSLRCFVGWTLSMASVCALIVGTLSFAVQPKLMWWRYHGMTDAVSSSPFSRIIPGHFEKIGGGEWVMYVHGFFKTTSENQTFIYWHIEQ